MPAAKPPTPTQALMLHEDTEILGVAIELLAKERTPAQILQAQITAIAKTACESFNGNRHAGRKFSFQLQNAFSKAYRHFAEITQQTQSPEKSHAGNSTEAIQEESEKSHAGNLTRAIQEESRKSHAGNLKPNEQPKLNPSPQTP